MYVKSLRSRKLFWSRAIAAIMLAMLLLAALPPSTAFAADTGYSSPSFAATNGRKAWANPTYSFTSDDLYASTAGRNKRLMLSYFNINPIQGNSIIDGIEVIVEGYSDGRQVKVEISGDGGASWSDAKQTDFSGTESVKNLGGPNDAWGVSWTAANFTNAQFRVRLTSTNATGTVYIDRVQVKVYFQPTDTTLTVPSVSENYGTLTTTLTATLTETIGGAPISGKTVNFTLFGASVGNAVTDGSGFASLSGVDISGLASGVYEDAIVANYLAGDGSGYDATYGIANLTIVGIPLTVTADPQTKYYGYPEPTLTYTYTGALLPGDSFSGNLLRDPGDAYGDYWINQGTLTAGPNYSITYAGDWLTIEPAPLTVTANNQSKLDTDPAITDFTFSYDGFVLGEDASALTTEPTCSLEAGADQSVAGTYDIICSGGVADNYAFAYVDGTLTVNAVNTPPTNITLDNQSVEENRLAGALVGTFTNNDPDLDTFTYSLVDSGVTCPNTTPYTTDNSFFTVDNDTLETAVKLNFEAKTSYEICVQVDDGNGGLYQKEFTISVVNLPETFLSQAQYDGWVRESSETSRKGGAKNSRGKVFYVGDDASNQQYRGILSFDASGIPDNAVVTSVTLKIKKAGLVGTDLFRSHRGLRVDISNLMFGTMPSLQISDFQAKASQNLVGRFPRGASAGWYTTTLSSAANPFVNTTGTTQFRLRFYRDDNNDFDADYFKFYSGNAPLASRPQLIVEYYVP